MNKKLKFCICFLIFLSSFGIEDSFCLLINKNSEKASLHPRIGLEISNTEPGKDTLKNAALKWSAAELWSKSVSENLKLEGNAIVLEDNFLIESDALTLGSIRSEAWDTLSKGVVLRKYLELQVMPLKNAWISMLIYPMVPSEPMSGGQLEFSVNGHKPIVYELRHFWTSVPVPAAYLKKGRNLIELRVHNQNEKFRIPMALSSIRTLIGQPTSSVGNSERSNDNGKTWKYAGRQSNSAEYPLRLKLQAYGKKAWLQTPVINLAGKGMGDVMYLTVQIESAEIKIDTTNSVGSVWSARIRSGNTHAPEAGEWTSWRKMDGSTLPGNMNHRFVQLEYSIQPGSGNKTPGILGLNIKSQWQKVATSGTIRVSEVKNYPLVRSSFDFVHENPALPELQQFRRQYRLDQVVEGAKTEWDKIKLLRAWTAANWDWFLPSSEFEDLLTWDASKILSGPLGSGNLSKKGGNCLHYAIVFAQACQSFGIPARIVNTNYAIWGGHELVEVWSRDYQKWIMADPNFDSSFYDKKTGIPLNILELHNLFLKTYYPGGEPIDRDKWSFEDRDRRASRIDPAELPIAMENGGHAFSGKINKEYTWWKVTFNKENPGYSGGYGFYNTAEVRWLPRSNWLSQKSPLPVTHGRTHWGWDGYYAWTDDQTPETSEHRYFVRRASDMYGSLFTVDFSAILVSEGLLKISMATDTPGFKHYELIDNGRKILIPGLNYQWKLVPGLNKLELRSIDALGNTGALSSLSVSYTPVSR